MILSTIYPIIPRGCNASRMSEEKVSIISGGNEWKVITQLSKTGHVERNCGYKRIIQQFCTV